MKSSQFTLENHLQ